MADNAPQKFTNVVKGLLRPLVRLLIARGVSAPMVYRALKEVYVSTAVEDFAIGTDRPTDSRVNILTGIHRRDVKSIREAIETGESATRQKATLLTTVIGRWTGSEQLRSEDGTPRPLPRSAPDGPSFETLVRQINRDIRPRTLLDELLRLNLVEIDESDMITLDPTAIIGPGDQDQKALFLAENVGDHLAAASENLMEDTPEFLERAVFYNNLSKSSIDAIEARARDLSQNALLEINAMARQFQEDDAQTGGTLQRFRYGVYFYREKADSDPED
ncbi:DUF6502 family protein [Aestuariibius insulae]|uniref:DUF6502 family protein n=1 Tax=Aestuariibius insulae TaxID=2058287 RepID=UPI00345EA960